MMTSLFRTSQPLLARNFLQRSMDELARKTAIAFKLEAIKGPADPRPLYEFHEQADVTNCVVMSDTLIGGSSQSNFDFITTTTTNTTTSEQQHTSTFTPPIGNTPPTSYARFHGTISTALPPDKPVVKRSGYAAFRTPQQPPTLFGSSIWDIDPYSFLALRIKSDGRSYFVNVQTEGVEPTDLHQHRLFSKTPGEWETVLVGWNDFVRTNYGFVVEPQTELLRQKVATIGIGLTDRVEGPFELCIERIWATNKIGEGQTLLRAEGRSSSASEGEGVSSLKNKKGEKIQW